MAGHVDWWGIGPVVFANLGGVWPGATIYVVGPDGAGASYVVTSIVSVPYDTPAEQVTGSIGVESLTLITCTGVFNGSFYESRLVVRAERF
jgi:sortase (surface protein transpeptidase)